MAPLRKTFYSFLLQLELRKPLPNIPKTDGPIKSEAGHIIRPFTAIPEMKRKRPLPRIRSSPGARPSIDDGYKELPKRNILTSLSEKKGEVEFSGQRTVYVPGKLSTMSTLARIRT